MQNRSKLTLGIFLIPVFALLGAGQTTDKSQRPSPPAKAQCKFSDGNSITVDYSSPRVKGRKIFGDLVPYGEVWRTGANEATSLVTTSASPPGRPVCPREVTPSSPFLRRASGR